MHLKISIIFLIIVTIVFACSNGEDKETDHSSGKAATVDKGAKLYRQYCVTCHGITGDMKINGAKDLTETVLGLEAKVIRITNGKGLMTPFKGILSEKEILQVAKYTSRLKKK